MPRLQSAPHLTLKATEDEKRLIAGYLGGRKLGVAELADAKRMPNRCASNPPLG